PLRGLHTARHWVKIFNIRDCLEDEPRSGRPCEVVTQKDVENVHSAFSVDSHRKMKELANRTEISYECAYTILHKELSFLRLPPNGSSHVLQKKIRSDE